MTPLLRCDQLSVGYGGKALLPPVSLAIHPGEFWAVIGRNGSGKTTWFRTLLGLLPAVSGAVVRGDTQVAYVGQRSQLDPLYPLPVAEVVAQGALRGWSFLRPQLSQPPGVAEALEAVGATDLAKRGFRTLSEGQKQRVLLARMVASGAQVALLDEPTAAMDAVAEREAMELLNRLRERFNLAVVVVSHHLSGTLPLANRALFVDPDHQAVVVGEVPEVCAHPAFRARYGEALAASLGGGAA
ncbi:MAG: ATP-binding cassette domain-containing protein [Alphaproteobacteria bacterium]|nr:ATP-binding cassette domain-containing protein [Alphaproteobacteria bacterium]MCB9796924.1 ATP-binding cassette domain-containing protein [Alphaproteobacteria bacterium]